MGESSLSSGGAQKESGPTRASYWSEIHVEMVALLIVVFVVLLIVGWSLRPSSSGYPSVRKGVTVALNTPGVNTVDVYMTRNADNSSVLTVIGDYGYSSKPAQLIVYPSDGARPCQPRHGPIFDVEPGESLPAGVVTPKIIYSHLAVTHYGDEGTGTMVLKSHRGDYFRLCWSSNGPVSVDGPYLSASLPVVGATGKIPIRMVLDPNAGNTSSYSLQATPSPSDVAGNTWTWLETAGSAGETLTTYALPSYSTPPVYLAAVNAGATQQDTLRAFFAGILLGIAGGALIAILQELVSPLSRRRDARHQV